MNKYHKLPSDSGFSLVDSTRNQPESLFESYLSGFQYKFIPFAGEQHTLGDLLHEFVPEVFVGGSAVIDNEWRVVIQGIEPPLETPIHWISEHFSHPDNFVYIVVVRVV